MTERPASEPPGWRIEAMGERAVLVILGDRLDLVVNGRARRLAAAVEAHRANDPRLGRAVAAAASVLVPFDALSMESAEATKVVGKIVATVGADDLGGDPDVPATADAAATRRPIEIEVRYGGPDGPDLEVVADAHGLRPDDIVELHAGSTWTALFLGFAPGFAYLGPLPLELATARRATPRERVPAGSVAIGGDQTAVYPFSLPGGWQIIGRTDAAMWDLRRTRPNLLAPGDLVRFVPVR
ncbi:MAG TPA: 5-oxoprolinase subunit PxpB [Methylomirabilota bacterium]|nr:5-oxoprolinase subunit PxpB [Methylomirabilota bacterium]